MDEARREDRFRMRSWIRLPLYVLLGIAAFFLVTEHRAHLFGVLPFMLLVLCPLLHLLHGKRHGRIPEQELPSSPGGKQQEVQR
jgi:ABC-type uncharacterized transport system permease subunit